MALRLRVEKSIVANVYKVQFSLVEITDSDLELMTKYGDATVDFGGTIGTPPPPGGVALANNVRSLRTGFPVLQTFDANAEAAAETLANLWESEITTRITAAMTTLRSNSDTFTSSTEQQF